MTIGEAKRVIEIKIDQLQDEAKEHTANNYQLAVMMVQFLGCSLNKKDIPPLSQFIKDFKDIEEQDEFREKHNGLTKQEYDLMCFQRDQAISIIEARKKKKEGKT